MSSSPLLSPVLDLAMKSATARRTAVAVMTALGVAAAGVGVWVANPIPGPMLRRDAGLGVTIEDRHGVPLRSTRAVDGSDTRWVLYDRVDPDLINAFVAV